MLAVGIDLVEVHRIQAAMVRYGDRFLTRVFTTRELSYCHGHPQKLAARFAAKEAVSKVLGIGIQHAEGVAWRDIEIISDSRGKPSAQLTGPAAERAREIGLRDLSISLSHTREHAIAIAVAD